MDGPEYAVGRFTLRPHRQLLADGVPVAIGRKGLQLLTVLAEAQGALVTKDELMAKVWSRAVVEENAVQVQIGALRKLLGSDGALLHTVRGLGYRLDAAVESPTTAVDAPDLLRGPPQPGDPQAGEASAGDAAASTAVPGPSWRALGRGQAAALATLALGAAGLLFFHGPAARSPPAPSGRVAVSHFSAPPTDPAARALADGLYEDVSTTLADGQVVTLLDEPAASRRPKAAEQTAGAAADMTLGGAVSSDGQTLDVRVRLEDAKERATLWSEDIKGSVAGPGALRAAVAARVGDVVLWSKVGRSGATHLDSESLASFIAGRESLTGVRHPDDMAALADYKRVVAAAPNFSWGHSAIAATEAFQLLNAADGPETTARRAAARSEAQRAIALDPHNGEAYLALELLEPWDAWSAREELLRRGVAVDPSFEPTSLMEGRLLWSVGRGRDALAWLRSAHELDAFHNGANVSLALALASEGYPEESRTLLKQMEMQWPDHGWTQDARFWVPIITQHPNEALKILGDPARRPSWLAERSVAVWRAAIMASAAHSPAAAGRADRAVLAAANSGWLQRGEALFLLAMLGDVDDAFAQARLYRNNAPILPPYLFLPAAAPLRADPRFMALAERLGLVTYWKSTGHWPDFCSDPGLRYDCRAEAAKAAKESAQGARSLPGGGALKG